MTTTEELRHLLDERGVEYYETATVGGTRFYFNWTEACGSYTANIGVEGADCYAERKYLTPAQAIEVTLGRGTCRIEHAKSGAMYDVWRCSECGYEYAERVDEEPIVQNYCPNCGRKTTEEDI